MASYKDYKSIAAARRAGSLYYTDKNGKKALAVTKETLDAWKKRNKGKFKGSALTAWANAKGKNLADKKAPATKPKAKPSTPGSKRPPKRPLGSPTLEERNPIKTEILLPGSDKTLEDVLKKKPKKKSVGSGRGDGAKETLQRQIDPKSPSRLKGRAVMEKITRNQWKDMSKSERRALGLPATRVAAMAGRLRDAKFKDGKSF
tara:strand:- start:390 stop:998 length:609 start_codon:yes stop_codon:yes gene_type:complete